MTTTHLAPTLLGGRLARVLLTVLIVLLASGAVAQRRPSRPRPRVEELPAPSVPPALMVQVDGKTLPVRVRDAAIDVRILGVLAETSMTLVFENPHDRVLEGTLYMPLPQGASISGYALDVDGVLVDGVVVEKDKARQVFEKEVRKGVDPGIVEWVKGNNFKTRVYPIPARGTRTIKVSYVVETVDTDKGAVFQLPLNFKDKVARFSLRVEVVRAVAKPVVLKGGPQGLAFDAWRDSYVADVKGEDVALTEDLVLALPDLGGKPVWVETDSEGTTWFLVRDTDVVVPMAEAQVTPDRVVLFWDASASRATANHARELKLLRAWLHGVFTSDKRATRPHLTVDLVVFRNVADAHQRFKLESGHEEALFDALKALRYDGGTQMGALSPSVQIRRPDYYLLFSDGVHSFGAEEAQGLDAPLFAFNTAATASHAGLEHLAVKTGGAYFNLTRLSDRDVLRHIGQTPFALRSVVSGRGEVLDLLPSEPEAVVRVATVTGRLTGEQATLSLRYGRGADVSATRKVTVSADDAARGELLRRYWASKKVAELSVFPKRNEAEITRLGKRYGLVTPGTSLMVLETLEQYVEHDIRPPAMLGEMRASWDEQKASLAASEVAERESRIEHVLALWQERVDWWSETYSYPKGFRYESEKKSKMAVSMARRSAPAPMAGAVAVDEAEMQMDGLASGRGGAGGEGRGRMKKMEGKEDGGEDSRREPEPAIVLSEWDPDTPYLKSLKAAPKAERLVSYFVERASHGSSPAFFLDVGDWFHKSGDPARALQVLSNIAELELENAALIRVLAHRLAQLDELDLAILLFEEARELRPEEPQSHRDLALVLARRAKAVSETRKADYARAVALLYHVVLNQWDRFDAIEVIALMELNALLPAAKAAGVDVGLVDARLVKLLDTDVRIVMTWDADLTDMDLHIIEPSGEEANYSHNRTTIGGMVSRDFTQGYGPEEYVLRKAMHGMYTVKTKFYGSQQQALAGAVTLQVDVFTNYGRPNERRRSMSLRLTENKEMFTVGKIEF